MNNERYLPIVDYLMKEIFSNANFSSIVMKIEYDGALTERVLWSCFGKTIEQADSATPAKPNPLTYLDQNYRIEFN